MRNFTKFVLSLMVMLLTSFNLSAAQDYVVSYDNDNAAINITWPEGTTVAPTDFLGSISISVIGYNGYVGAGVYGQPNVITAYVDLPSGEYTVEIPAGQFTVNGVENEALSEPLVVSKGNDAPSAEGETEVVFTAYDLGSKGVQNYTDVIEGEGVSLSVNAVSLNVYECGDLYALPTSTLTFTSKKDAITSIIFEGMDEATADRGSFDKGVWTAAEALKEGESVTITPTWGSAITKITVCYNGGSKEETTEDEKGVITIQWPTENMPLEKITDGGILAQFTTNKQYAMVTVELRNLNDIYHNLYDLPARYMDQLAPGEHTCKTSTPGESDNGGNPAWYTFNGDAYELIVKGFVNYWDEIYDAMAVVPVVGIGKEHEGISPVKLINITPETNDNEYGKVAMLNGVVTLEFDGPVRSVSAATPMGFDGAKPYTTSPKAGSDNTVWEVSLGDLTTFASAESETSILELNITAKDMDGATIAMSDDRADRALVVKYILTEQIDDPEDAVILGNAVFSVAEGDEISAGTEYITISFPNATNVEGDYTLSVAGTIGDKNFSFKQVSGSGTMAEGAAINVALEAEASYNMVIGTITICDAEGAVVFSTEMGNYSLNFTTASAAPAPSDDVLGAMLATTNENGITLSWPNADLSAYEGKDIEVMISPVTVNVDGVTCDIYPDAISDLSEGLSVEIPYEKIAVYDPTIGEWGEMVPVEITDGQSISISIAEGCMTIVDYSRSFFGDTVYSNADAITATVSVVTAIRNAVTVNAKTVYNVAGQKVNKAKGLVIVNGKKVMVK